MFTSVFTIITVFCLTPVHCNFHLQILHCNDLHARFLETDKFSASCPDDFIKNHKCFGGFARLKEAAIEAKTETKKQNISSVFVNAGDTFQGTPFYTLLKWKICADLVAKMQFDVMTIGNHEFDDGIDGIVNFLKNANTPTVCSNLNFDSEPRLKIPVLTSSYVMTVENKKIAFIGYLTPDTMKISNAENLEIYPEIPSVQKEAKRLKSEGIDIIIGLGHSGVETDLRVAEQIEEISLIIGAHSHTFMYTPPDKPPSTESTKYSYPTWVTKQSGKKVPIVQAYAYTKYLGKLIVEFDDQGNVLSATGNPILLDASINQEQKIQEAVAVWSKTINDQIRQVKGYTRTFLGRPEFSKGIFQGTFGNLMADAMVDLVVKYSSAKKIDAWTIASIAFYPNSGIRSQIDHKRNNGAITVEDLMTIAPFNDKITLVTMRGKNIKNFLETTIQFCTLDDLEGCKHDYIHISGMRIKYNLNKPTGNKIQIIEVVCNRCDIPKFVPLEDETLYQVITVSWVSDGGGNFHVIKSELLNSTNLEWTEFECVQKYIEKSIYVYPKLDDRVVIEDFHNHKEHTNSAFNRDVDTKIITIMCVILKFLLR